MATRLWVRGFGVVILDPRSQGGDDPTLAAKSAGAGRRISFFATSTLGGLESRMGKPGL